MDPIIVRGSQAILSLTSIFLFLRQYELFSVQASIFSLKLSNPTLSESVSV